MKRPAKQLTLYTDWYALQLDWEKSILNTFLQATPAQIVEGKRWYPQAQATLDQIVSDSRIQMDITRAAAICAVLSPRITWQSNVEGVKRIFKALWTNTSICPTVAGVRRNVDKAWDIAQGGTLETVSGPKVSAFYANLCGNLERVTIDTWAARAAGLDDKHHNHLDRMRYAHLEKAYQTVAHELEFRPAELQAICWIVVRGKGE